MSSIYYVSMLYLGLCFFHLVNCLQALHCEGPHTFWPFISWPPFIIIDTVTPKVNLSVPRSPHEVLVSMYYSFRVSWHSLNSLLNSYCLRKTITSLSSPLFKIFYIFFIIRNFKISSVTSLERVGRGNCKHHRNLIFFII